MDTLFLIAGKAVWFFLRPETLLLLLFALPLFLLWRGRVAGARRWLTVGLCAAIISGAVPVGNLVLNPLERAYPARPQVANPAGIIVLGGMEDLSPAYTGRMAQVNDAGERLIVATELARRFPEAVVLYSGGQLALAPVDKGAFEIGPDILRRLGLPENRLLVEGRSRSTAENATFSRALVPDQDERPWLLVTSAFHMPRALGSFCAAGWRNLTPWPVDYRGGELLENIGWDLAGHLHALNTGVKEWIGLLAYRQTGRTGSFFPDGCSSPAARPAQD
ncbi:YdcF family protein [Roseobacter ponti]|uniref:YdcF family protein n=1 Tax=Roseobacter ponti TaxID=1891787 RepID=A0A858SVK1_9RHOB|nr:YdcF family protein [Roseobacter ponti]QJF51862.1 YdcF family protein [Roseobacter ponti]